MKTVALVGAEGYLGGVTRAQLRRAGYNVVSVDSLLWKGQEAEEGTWVGDASSPEGIAFLEGVAPDCIVYLGAVAHDPAGAVPRAFAAQHTREAPLVVRSHFLRTPFVFVSSMSVFDVNLKRDSYGRDKQGAERVLRDTEEKSVAILRFGTLWGPAQTVGSFREHLLLNSMVLGAVRSGIVSVRNPKTKRPTYRVSDAAADILRAVSGFLGEGVFAGGTISNCYSRMGTIEQYAAWVATHFDNCSVVTTEEGVDQRDYDLASRWWWTSRGVGGGMVRLVEWVEFNKGEIKKKEYKNAQ